jgi:hypothetical protein
MRANNLDSSMIFAGRDYVMPSDADYAESSGRMGQRVLNQDNKRSELVTTDRNSKLAATKTVREGTEKSSSDLMNDAGIFSMAYAWATSNGDHGAAKEYLKLAAATTVLSSQMFSRESAIFSQRSNGSNFYDQDNYSSRNPFSGADGTSWSTGEDRVGRPGRGYDYISVQANFYVFSGGNAINLHSGEVYGQWSLGRQYPHPSSKPGFSVVLGDIIGVNAETETSNFLRGAGWQASAFYPIPNVPIIGAGGGVNHSYGGGTAIEYGLSVPPGAAVAPFGYGFDPEERR